MEALEERLGYLEGPVAALDGIEGRLLSLKALCDQLPEIHRLTLEAVAQSQDALNTSSLARAHEDRLNTLTLAVAEGIQHVERAEYRIRATVTRARRELADAGLESPGLEAEAASLRLVDGGEGEGSRVPSVPAHVEDVEDVEDVDPLLERLKQLRLSR